VTLDAHTLEQLAERVAELVSPRLEPAGLVDADAVARYLNVERAWVYENAIRLRARRLGDGPKARLRFSLKDVDEAVTCYPSRESGTTETPAIRPKRARARRANLGTNVHLLPIKGPREAA